MRVLAVTRLAGWFGPAGLVEGLLCAVFFAAWLEPFLFGQDTPSALRFVLVAEAGYVFVRILFAAPMEQDASGVETGFWVLIVGAILGAFLMRDGGWVGAAIYGVHLVVDLPRLQGLVAEPRAFRFRKALVPAAGLATGLLASSVGLVPELGWESWAIPSEFWFVSDDGRHRVTHVIPATGFIYFFAMAVVARSQPLARKERL